MVDNDSDVLARHGTADHQESAGSPQGVLWQYIYIRYKLHVTNLEELRVIQQSAVNTTLVGTFNVYKLEVLGFQWFLITEVCQAFGIFHLTDADGGTAHARQFVSTHLRKHTSHVLQFVSVLQPRPLVGAVGQVLIIVLTGIMTGVKQIFQIVESYAIHRKLLLCLGCVRS